MRRARRESPATYDSDGVLQIDVESPMDTALKPVIMSRTAGLPKNGDILRWQPHGLGGQAAPNYLRGMCISCM